MAFHKVGFQTHDVTASEHQASLVLANRQIAVGNQGPWF